MFGGPDLVHNDEVDTEQPIDATGLRAMNYFISFLVGLAFGVGYALLGVKSPAPPLVALFGLLGMVSGEQGTTWIRQHGGRIVVSGSAASPPGDVREGR